MLDLNKPIKTRDGHKVTIYTTKGKGLYSIHGCVHIGKFDYIAAWNLNGEHELGSEWDLVNVTTPCIEEVSYLNIYPNKHITEAYKSRTEADECATKDRIACIKIEWEEGQYDV